MNKKTIILTIILAVLLFGISTRIFAQPDNTSIDLEALSLGGGYYINSDGYEETVSIECDAICPSYVGFPLVMYDVPGEHDIIDRINLVNTTINLLIYLGISSGIVFATQKIVKIRAKNNK